MKLYTGMGPNPRVVTIAVAETGADVDVIEVDLVAGENRQEEHLARNPAGQLPTLELDDGTCIAEITAIAEYLDDKTEGSLIGKTPEERAETHMWVRRIDLNICENMANGFRYALQSRYLRAARENKISNYPPSLYYLGRIGRNHHPIFDSTVTGCDNFRVSIAL